MTMKLSLLCFFIAMMNEMIAAKYILVEVEGKFNSTEKQSFSCCYMSCLEQQLINCHDILEPSVPGLQSRSGKGGNNIGWTNFQGMAHKSVRGRLLRRDPMQISPQSTRPEGVAMSKCRRKCQDRPGH